MALRPQPYGKTIIIDGDFPTTLRNGRSMTPDNYQIEVLGQLRVIETKTQSGKALLGGLNRLKGKICRIIPVRYDDPGFTITRPVDSTRSLIEYNPWTWTFKDKTQKIDPNKVGYEPDYVLFHELVHAFLQLARIFRSVPLSNQYHNREDFYAVLFANIYVAERNNSLPSEEMRKRLRGSHELTFQTLNEGEPDVDQANDPSVRFYKKYKTEIDDLFHSDNADMTKLAEELAAVSCSFNPIRSRPKSEYVPFESPFGNWTPK